MQNFPGIRGGLTTKSPRVLRSLALVALVAVPGFAAEPPRLGVVLVIDQLSAETFNARVPKLTGGIKRMMNEGYTVKEARFESAPTITSSGHATIVTGAYASVHGIVANDWIDVETGQPRLSTQDAAYQVVGRPAQERDGTAPTWLMAPTLADSVRLSNEKAMSLSVSAKDRSAILCAGKAGLAVWFDAEKPFFTTSTYYRSELPPFLAPVNQRIAEMIIKGTFVWALPGGGITGQSPSLPAAGGRQGDSEPFAERKEIQTLLDTAEIDVALEGVKVLGLGKDEIPDLLTISFSGHDRIGHEFGPDSPESLEDFLHVDREIGRLLTQLDTLVGKGKYVVVLTSDHGVAPVPDLAKARGLDAGHADLKKLMAALDRELDEQLGGQDWFAGSKTPGLTFKPGLKAKAMTQFARLQKVAMAQPGILELQSMSDLTGPHGAMFSHGYFPGRSPDLLVVTKPYWVYNKSDRTGHASDYLYDRAVPMLFFGAGVKKGEVGYAEMTDVAPSMARLMSVAPPAAAAGHSLF